MKKLLPRFRAFTLIELLIVITIIGILAVALIPRLTGGPGRARDAQRKSDLQQIATALEFYNDDNGTYPASPTGYCVSSLTLSSYLTTVPTDPSSDGWGSTYCSGGYGYVALNTDGSSSITTDLEGYLLFADLETETDRETGIWMTSFSVSATATASTNMASSTLTTDCFTTGSCSTTTDVIYVVGR